MANFYYTFQGNIDDWADFLDREVPKQLSSELVDQVDEIFLDEKILIRNYERYGFLSSNRLALSVTLIGRGKDLWISATSAGGSGALVFKVNTWSEEGYVADFKALFKAQLSLSEKEDEKF